MDGINQPGPVQDDIDWDNFWDMWEADNRPPDAELLDGLDAHRMDAQGVVLFMPAPGHHGILAALLAPQT